MGLIRRAGGESAASPGTTASSQRWESSLRPQLDAVATTLRQLEPAQVASRCGGRAFPGALEVDYWGRPVKVHWPELTACETGGQPCSPFERMMLLFYLRQSDGAQPAGEWISFRELPGGNFYHQAFQGYACTPLARVFGTDPAGLGSAAGACGGAPVDGPAADTWGFRPLPLVWLAVAMWPGEEGLPSQAAVLFDRNASHHLPLDGLALLGSGLSRRLLAAHRTIAAEGEAAG
jgi:hypothetical protein